MFGARFFRSAFFASFFFQQSPPVAEVMTEVSTRTAGAIASRAAGSTMAATVGGAVARASGDSWAAPCGGARSVEV